MIMTKIFFTKSIPYVLLFSIYLYDGRNQVSKFFYCPLPRLVVVTSLNLLTILNPFILHNN